MKPKPFSSLNHLTVPVGMLLYPSCPMSRVPSDSEFGREPTMQCMRASGEGWAVASLNGLGEGPGFRKVRKELGVEAFGINAIVMPPGVETGYHWYEQQDEVYFVHAGRIEMEFNDGGRIQLAAGSFAHVQARAHRKVKNVGDTDAIYVIV